MIIIHKLKEYYNNLKHIEQFELIPTDDTKKIAESMLNDIEKALKEAKIKYYMNGEENGRKNTISKSSNTSYERRRKKQKNG